MPTSLKRTFDAVESRRLRSAENFNEEREMLGIRGDRMNKGRTDRHALSRISYVDQNAAAPPLPQQPPPTSWGHDLTDIEKFCWENFEKWPRIRLFYQIFKNLRKKKIFFGKNFV